MLAPIGGGVGEDISYDERFEALKNEVDKLQALEGGKVDWGMVASTADELLAERSKDFRVAIYYAAARAQLDGPMGLLEGLLLVRDLDAAFWETMFPALRRPKARGNLVGWMSSLTAPSIASYSPRAPDADVLAALDEVSREVDADLRDKLADNYGGMGELRQAIRNVLTLVPKPAPPPAPPLSTSSSTAPERSALPPRAVASFDAPAPTSDAQGITLGALTDEASAMSAISEMGLLLRRAGDALRTADPANPLAYRYARTGAWLELVVAPPAEGGQTLVPSPPSGIREQLDAMVAAENWLGVITLAEESAAEYILWLDPHRYAANAMDRLGALFINAKKALLRELAILTMRVPTMASLAFNDGTPFADGPTKMWLEAEVQPALGSGSAGGAGSSSASTLDGPVAEGRQLAASGRLAEAIELVTKAVASAPSPADRFRGRLALAKLCLSAEQFAIARAQLEGLDRLVELHHLDEWEPSLCADLYAALYAAHRGFNRGEEVSAEARAKESAAFQRLCQLDAGAALRLATEA